MTLRADREFDLVLLGATGFVGRLTAQHLARHAPADLRVALSARSAGRLAELHRSLGPAAHGWAEEVVDVTDDDSVRGLVSRTRVLLSTVGPYLRHGLPVVRACADLGTDYADLTGETLFVRRSIDACHERAVQTGARIVHACGFDSVPSDLGVGLAAARVAADGQGQLADTVLRVRSIRGGVSGGTVDSLRQQLLEVSRDAGLRRVVSDPECLVDGEDPRSAAVTEHQAAFRLPIRRGREGHWQTPWVMGLFNRQIVLRTNALSGWVNGPMFRYREVVDTGSGVTGLAGAAAVAAGAGVLVAGMSFTPTRRVLDRLLPDPGQGPSEKTRRSGRFAIDVDAVTTGGATYTTRIAAPYDPGYDGTAVMLGESGLSLAVDEQPDRGGVLTPMVALGEPLAIRLRAGGFTVETTRSS